MATKGKRASAAVSNTDLGASSNCDSEKQLLQQRKSRGKNIENLQGQATTSLSKCAVNDEGASVTKSYDASGTVAAPIVPPEIYSTDPHHHHHFIHHQHMCAQGGPVMMPPPPPPPPVQSNNNQRVTRGKNILNQQQHPQRRRGWAPAATACRHTTSAVDCPPLTASG